MRLSEKHILLMKEGNAINILLYNILTMSCAYVRDLEKTKPYFQQNLVSDNTEKRFFNKRSHKILGSNFSSDFEHHCRRMIRLLWHCCGHLYTKHWDHLQILNLRPQCGLAIAHLTKIAKIFALLDTKEYAVLAKTLYLVRPPIIPEPPAKRIGAQHDDQGNSSSNDSSIRWNKVPAAKSGSWGGHPTPTVLSCKPYAQTC